MRLPELLTTPRLRLRRMRMADAATIYREFATDPEVTRFVVWAPHADVRDSIAFLEQCDDGWDTGFDLTWALTLPPADDAIGVIGIRPESFKADMGFVLARKYWRRGLMTEAGRALIACAFESLAVVRIWATCDVDNHASARVLEKIGMTREGVLRRWMVHPNISPAPRDAAIYSIVRPEAPAAA